MSLAIRLTLLVLPGMLAMTVQAAEPTPERQQELRYLVRQDCGSCHGMTLKGGLGPPLTREALLDKPPELLLSTILDGRPGTAMPPWRPFLSDDDSRWIVKQLTSGQLGS